MSTKHDEVSRSDALQYAINLIGSAASNDLNERVVKSLAELKKSIDNRNAKERAKRAIKKTR